GAPARQRDAGDGQWEPQVDPLPEDPQRELAASIRVALDEHWQVAPPPDAAEAAAQRLVVDGVVGQRLRCGDVRRPGLARANRQVRVLADEEVLVESAHPSDQ